MLASVKVVVVLLCLAVGLLSLMHVVNRPLRFDVVAPDLPESAMREIAEVLAAYQSERFLTLCPRALRQHLHERPWIDRVSVWKHWPGRIIVKISPEVPVAVHANGELLDSEGRFIGDVLASGEMLTRISAVPGREAEAVYLMRQARQQLHARLGRISDVTWGMDRDVRIRFASGASLHLGRREHLARLELTRQLVERISEKNDYMIGTIDTRYRNDGIAVTWR